MLNVLQISVLIVLMIACFAMLCVIFIQFLRWLIKRKLANKPQFDFTPVEFKCSHIWKPFPWYVDSMYNTDTRLLHINIYKPYVCIHCKEIKTEQLDAHTRYAKTVSEANHINNSIVFGGDDKIKHKSVVMEMIADMKLVDREKLRIAEQLGMIDKEENNG